MSDIGMEVSTHMDYIIAWKWAGRIDSSINTTPAMQVFIQKFDTGKYPELIAEDKR